MRPASHDARFSLAAAGAVWLGAYVAALPLQAAVIGLLGQSGVDPDDWPTSTMVATVRPITTYIFVLELAFINVGLGWYVWTHPEMIKTVEDLVKVGNEIFSEDEMSMLGAIIGYWFGSRGWSKK